MKSAGEMQPTTIKPSMKKPKSVFTYALVLVLAGVLLSSCTGMRQLREDLKNSREPDKDKFVVTNGTEIESKKLTFKSPLFKAQKVVLDDGTEVKIRDVEAYQDDNAYYLRLNQYPYGFAHRMKRGAINMYLAVSSETVYDPGAGARIYNSGSRTWSSTGGYTRRTRYHYFLEKDNSKRLLQFTPDNVENMVRGYTPAMEFMDIYKNNKKKYKTWSLVNTGAVLAGLVMMLTSVEGDKVKPHGYAGVGLFLGGLISGFVNKINKVKNVTNLSLAVDEYNTGSRKKK